MQHIHLKTNIIHCDHCGDRSKLPALSSKEVMAWMGLYEEKHGACIPSKAFTITRFNVEPIIAAAFEAYSHKKRTGLDDVWLRYLDKTFGEIAGAK